MTAHKFDLRSLVQEVIDNDTSEDLNLIIKEIMRRTPPEMAHEALEQVLAIYVRDTAANSWAMAADAAVQRKRDASPKVKAIRENWRRQLEDIRYAVQDGKMRRLGDMNRADLVFVAEVLEYEARQKRLQAHVARALAQAMTDHDVTRVRDLPSSYLEKMFGQAP